MSRDLASQTAARFAQEWSGPRAAGQLQPEALEALVPRFSSMEPLVQSRVLLSACFMPPSKLAECRSAFRTLAQASLVGDDEWFQVTGRACGDFNGTLDLNAVTAESSLVAGTLTQLNSMMDTAEPCADFRPLEEQYLSPRAAAARGATRGALTADTQHFRLRNPKAAASKLAAAPQHAAATVVVPMNLAALNLPDKQMARLPGATSTTTVFGQRTSAATATANTAADMFLPTRPAFNRSAASSGGERIRATGSSSRQPRTKQLPVHEVAAMQQKKAKAAKAAAAAKAATTAAALAAAAAQRASRSTAASSADSADDQSDSDPQQQKSLTKSGVRDDSDNEDPPTMLSLDAYLSVGKRGISRPSSTHTAASTGEPSQPRLSQLPQQQRQPDGNSDGRAAGSSSSPFDSAEGWQHDDGDGGPYSQGGAQQLAGSEWRQDHQHQQEGSFDSGSFDQTGQDHQTTLNRTGSDSGYGPPAQREQSPLQTVSSLVDESPSSPESGEVEEGQLSPAAKRRRTDDTGDSCGTEST